jgi:hypothetical protein
LIVRWFFVCLFVCLFVCFFGLRILSLTHPCDFNLQFRHEQTDKDEFNWMAWNQRVLRNEPGIVFPASAQTEILRFWLPFTETDGPFSNGHDVLNQCFSSTFGGSGGCCDCDDLGSGRYGNTGFVDESADSQDVGIWLPHTNINQADVSMAFVHQAPSGTYLTGNVEVECWW